MNLGIAMVASYVAALEGKPWVLILSLQMRIDFMDSSCWMKSYWNFNNFRETSCLISFQIFVL